MFKTTKHLSLSTLLSLYTVKPITTYTNKLDTNLVSVKVINDFKYSQLLWLTDFSYTFAVDIAGVHNCKLNNVYTNNFFYNYKYDQYLNILDSESKQLSLSHIFFNRVWLEREVLESFNTSFYNLFDTRPLLLNYGDNVNTLLKSTSTQANSELKTVWHFRKISKFKNSNIEL